MKKTLPSHVSFLSCVLLIALFGLSCQKAGEDAGREPSRSLAAVEAVQARQGALPLEEKLTGVVKAQNQITIRPEIDAMVAEVLVESGQAVTQGQPLLRLDDLRLRDQLRQTEASVRLAEASANEARARLVELEAQVSRTRKLAEQKLVSELELETREAQILAAKANAERAEAQVEQAAATAEESRSALSKTIIRAPIAGRVGQRQVEPGQLVNPSSLLFEIGNLDRLIVEISLTEKMLAYVHEGMEVRLEGAGTKGPLSAELARISPFLAAGSFSTIGEVDVDNRAGTLRPGMFVQVDVLYGKSEPLTLVPTSALWEDPASRARGVYVVQTGQTELSAELSEETFSVTFHNTEPIAEGRGMIGFADIEPGQWIVTVGQNLLRGDAENEARVRAARWDRILELQGLQRENLLDGFLEKQQRLARQRGAQPPSSKEFLGESAARKDPVAAPPTSPADSSTSADNSTSKTRLGD